MQVIFCRICFYDFAVGFFLPAYLSALQGDRCCSYLLHLLAEIFLYMTKSGDAVIAYVVFMFVMPEVCMGLTINNHKVCKGGGYKHPLMRGG